MSLAGRPVLLSVNTRDGPDQPSRTKATLGRGGRGVGPGGFELLIHSDAIVWCAEFNYSY